MSSEVPEYFSGLGENLADVKMSEILTINSLPLLTNRMIYRSIANFPMPRVGQDSIVDFSIAWKRLHTSKLSSEESGCLYLLINNKLPVPERLHRISVRDTPYCVLCPGLIVSDVLHYFCSCLRTRGVWSWIKS